jgi:hypothetical protein
MSAFHLTREADADLDEMIDYYRDKTRAEPPGGGY